MLLTCVQSIIRQIAVLNCPGGRGADGVDAMACSGNLIMLNLMQFVEVGAGGG
jgi:hypothetical protein